MKLFCWTEEQETEHRQMRPGDGLAQCLSCGLATWIEDYPIADWEVPSNPLIEARQAYQRAKRAYYGQLQEERNDH